MENRPRSYQGFRSQSSSSSDSPYGSQARGSTDPAGSSEMPAPHRPVIRPMSRRREVRSTPPAPTRCAAPISSPSICSRRKSPTSSAMPDMAPLASSTGCTKTDRIRHISPRIEQAGGFMADVYYRLTGQPLAVYTSTGPGPMNMMISVADAFYDCSAFFVITGQVPTTQFDTGALQDDYRYPRRHVLDVRAHRQEILAHSQGRGSGQSAAGRVFHDAHRRPGPVHFDMPYDLYMRTAPVTAPDPHGHPLNWRTTVADETVERALDLLTSAQRPLILAGGGVRVGRAYDELKALADNSTSRSTLPSWARARCHRSSPPSRRRRRLGRISGAEAARNADVILAIGARFNHLPHRIVDSGLRLQYPADQPHSGRIDPEEIGRNLPVEIGIVGDAKAFLSQAVSIARAKGARRAARQSLAQGNRSLARGLAQFLRTLRTLE